MEHLWSLETVAGQLAGPDLRLKELVPGRLWVGREDAADGSRVVVRLDFRANEGFLLKPEGAVRLGEMLRAHAALAHQGLPWQADPDGKPSKARHENPPHGGWLQCYTPWPPAEQPVVWLIGWEHVVLDLAQAVAVATALEEVAAA